MERKLGAISTGKIAVAVCDLQERFEPSILHFKTIVENSTRLVKAAKLLDVPVIATEQYPKVNIALSLLTGNNFSICQDLVGEFMLDNKC